MQLSSKQDKKDIRKEEEAAAAEAKAAVEERRRRMEEARRKRAADSAAAAVLRSEMFEDARIAAEADQQEAKLNLLEQLRTRRAEVERIMAQRQAERDGEVRSVIPYQLMHFLDIFILLAFLAQRVG